MGRYGWEFHPTLNSLQTQGALQGRFSLTFADPCFVLRKHSIGKRSCMFAKKKHRFSQETAKKNCRFSQETAKNRRFSHETTENGRFSHETAENGRLVFVPLGLSPSSESYLNDILGRFRLL